MAGQQRNMEGNEEQKQAAGREAKAQGKKPSEVGATTGASKQTKKAPNDATHQEKMDLKHEGKQGGGQSQNSERARPGNRDTDPSRDDADDPTEG
jgi:hypothetical protein